MRKLKSAVCAALALTTCFCFAGCGGKNIKSETTKNDDTFQVVSSFYPMHILAMNLTAGIDGVTETSMSEPNIGCIHDHTFTTDDLKKVEGADVYIENGLGLEAFNETLENAYPELVIVEASKNITDEDISLHVWTNIDYYISQVSYVSEQLQTLDPDNQDAYAANEEAYTAKLEQLIADNHKVIDAAAGKKVLVLDEALQNLCVYLKMDMIKIESDHEEEALSADDLKQAIRIMNEKDIKTIFIGKDADRSAAETIAAETGAAIYELNTCMTGTDNSAADSYVTEMQENFDIIAAIE